MNPVNLVSSITSEINYISDLGGQLPLLPSLGLKGLYLYHLGWWCYRKKKLYETPENFFPLIAGHVANFAVRSTWLRAGAKLLHILIRIEECGARIFALYKAWGEFCDCLYGRYCVLIEPDWVRGSNSASFFSPTIKNRWLYQKRRLNHFLSRVYQCMLKIFACFHHLGMQLWDTYDAFYVKDEAMIEVFTNLIKLLEKKNDFIAKLKNKQALIDKMLSGMQLNLKSEMVIKNISEALESAESLASYAKQASTLAHQTLVNSAKQNLRDLLSVFNIVQILPDSMLPKENLNLLEKN